MGISRKCLRASAKARKGETSYVAILKAGEHAAVAGHSRNTNPYPAGSEDAAIWAEGFDDLQIMREGTLQDIAEYEGEA